MSPTIRLSRVDLPQPEGPTTVRNSPARMSRSTPASAATSPRGLRNFSDTFLSEMIGPSCAPPSPRCVRTRACRLFQEAVIERGDELIGIDVTAVELQRIYPHLFGDASGRVDGLPGRVDRRAERLGIDFLVGLLDGIGDFRGRLGSDVV